MSGFSFYTGVPLFSNPHATSIGSRFPLQLRLSRIHTLSGVSATTAHAKHGELKD
jgi:hypothetical protein